MKVNCPRCKIETEFAATNPYRPFCSERCQMIDLGQWAEGRYAIPSENHQDAADESLESRESSSQSADSDDTIH